MDKLTKLAIKYKTDKWGKHNYTPVYYDLFKKKAKRNKVKKVLEIGVAEGAGVRMFRDFFPNAMIYGAEIADDRLFEEDRIEVIKCDQSNRDHLIELLHKTGTDLDFVVDDGSHKPQDQVFTAFTIFPLLEKGATYVIEDVADDAVYDTLKKRIDCEYKRVGKRYDDALIIMKK